MTEPDKQRSDHQREANAGDAASADYYWRMFLENCEHGRHHESQRQGITNLILILTGAAITVISHEGVQANDRWLAVFIVFLGLFGAAFSYKCYERFRCHMSRASEAISRLENCTRGLDLASIITEADSKHRQNYAILPRVRLYWYWFAMNAFVITIGGVLLWQTFTR